MEKTVQLGVVGIGNVETTSFEDDALIAVVIDRDFGIRGITCVAVARVFLLSLIPKPTTVAHDRVWMRDNAQAPTGNVGLMWSLITKVTVAVVTLPMPVVVKPLASDLGAGKRRRPAPEVKVDFLWHRVIA